MASIKEIAQLANVSQGTASMVLNGKGDKYRISAATQQKILEAAKQLNYQPNISARRLRSGGETVLPIIALFWTLDTRAALVGRFLKGLQHAMSELEDEYELLIHPYVGTKLSEVQSLVTGTRFNGAIIANSTEEDDEFLETADLNVPVVLYQRDSNKYASVSVDSYESGGMVAEMLYGRGHRKVGLIVPDVSSRAIRLREAGFMAKAAELGMDAGEAWIVYEDFSEQGGYEAVKRLKPEGGAWPSAIFALSDQMAVGALKALDECGVKVPEELEIIGYDNDEVTNYTVPTLSTVHLPVEEMAGESLRLLIEMMRYQTNVKTAKQMDTRIVMRKSCGGPTD
ncbi:LacI family transcriptional regulator [Paenibacillus oralis]|uniref:LacI family transcriptional regulator n=1 Tax=Paenibacillus oralis TaxID=2490856 RepID=A0A3P3U2B4_9BACL|nr:LacI family DNA-binding transcriptional regulator [Paenibacillus oralis]RRJ64204.1 LacI family transcriptional regulator [Paenibacillus oralis]